MVVGTLIRPDRRALVADPAACPPDRRCHLAARPSLPLEQSKPRLGGAPSGMGRADGSAWWSAPA